MAPINYYYQSETWPPKKKKRGKQKRINRGAKAMSGAVEDATIMIMM